MMDLNVIRKMDDAHVPINEFLALLWENTAEDGTLHVPYTSHPIVFAQQSVLTTRMDWDMSRFEKSVEDFYALVAALKALAPHHHALWEQGADPATLLTDPVALHTYRTYGIPLDDGDFDRQRIADINDRLETLRLVQDLKDALACGKLNDEESRAFVMENEGVTVSEEERAYSDAYGVHLRSCAAQRVGDAPMAYDVYIHGQRLWRLHGMGAPALILRIEEQALATAFMIHRHGTQPLVSVVEDDWDEE